MSPQAVNAFPDAGPPGGGGVTGGGVTGGGVTGGSVTGGGVTGGGVTGGGVTGGGVTGGSVTGGEVTGGGITAGGVGFAETSKVNEPVTLFFRESEMTTLNANGPGIVGVPVKFPLGLREKPCGNDDLPKLQL